MRNQADIRPAEGGVHVICTKRNNLLRKVTVAIINMAVLAGYIYLLSYMQKHHVRAYLVPAIVAFVICIFLPWRYLFWICFGKEHVIISSTAIDYFYDYGIVKTKRARIAHNGLTVKYKFVHKIEDEEQGRLLFISYFPDSRSHKEIYETSVLLPKNDLLQIQEKVHGMFNSDSGSDLIFRPV